VRLLGYTPAWFSFDLVDEVYTSKAAAFGAQGQQDCRTPQKGEGKWLNGRCWWG